MAVSSLNKEDLLSRAAMFPAELRDAELELLIDRYWLDADIVGPYLSTPSCNVEAIDRLERACAVLYGKWEKAAIENAGKEAVQR